MTDHLPECKALDVMPEGTKMFRSTSTKWFWEHGCICERLRACEQRIRQTRTENGTEMAEETNSTYQLVRKT